MEESKSKSLLVAPKDNITANFDSNTSAPAYHTLRHLSYINFDAYEWQGRAKKYKQEIIRNAERVRTLQLEVLKLRNQFDKDTDEFDRLHQEIAKSQMENEQVKVAIKEELKKKDEMQKEFLYSKRQHETLKQDRDALNKDLSEVSMRIRKLQGEVDRNQKRWQGATHEKGKLNLEADWFFQERLLLELSTAHEKEDADRLKEQIHAMRISLQQTWLDAKKSDVLGLLRATRSRPGENEWYAARTRTLAKKGIPAGG